MALVEDGALLGSRQLDMGNSGLTLLATDASRHSGTPPRPSILSVMSMVQAWVE